MNEITVDAIVKRLLNGDKNALARVISILENKHSSTKEVLKMIYPHVGKAHRVGITGPPGAGKSTLTDLLAIEARNKGVSVGIVAVDPTSPFTGGAILGDRIRMTKASHDGGIFIRSMASRGALGGIAPTTRFVVDAVDAAGKEIIFIETVGVGQSELDIFYAVDTVVVVIVPESGSGVQVMKAGLMEIAHCFVINKADRGGGDLLKQEIEDMFNLVPQQPWDVKVLLTQANKGIGVRELFLELERHWYFLGKDELEKQRCLQNQRLLHVTVLDILKSSIFEQSKDLTSFANTLAKEITNGKVDPLTAACQILAVYDQKLL